MAAAPLGAAPQAVLFVCDHNVIRSPMAWALTQRRFGRTLWTESCGVSPGAGADPFVAAVLDEVGVDLGRHRPRGFEDLDNESFDLIVTLSPKAHHRALEFTRTMAVDVEYWPTLDPSNQQGSREQRLEEYRAVRDALDARIAQRFLRRPPG